MSELVVDNSPANEESPEEDLAEDAGWAFPVPSAPPASPQDADVSMTEPHAPAVQPPTDEPMMPGVDPFDAAAVCTSGTYWSGKASVTMHPGHACISCHSGSANRPQFKIAGTVFPTAHEPDDCNAQNPAGVRVEIVYADGQRVELEANGVGNFSSLSPGALPYTASVLSQGRVRAMRTPQRSGDCNSCHTQSGDHGAPGRILLP